ncbi:MAG: transglutaminase domain-containing protein, partial [Candidatus Electryonea clarkiae]|nr:transglutaminase domain-containing protein [Candidatus Electryonea clarkiae]
MTERLITAAFFLLFLTLQANAVEIESKTRFLEEALVIDSAAAIVFSGNLTDADWFETTTEMLLESFRAALEVRERFAWGKFYSDSDFFNYVLPLRVDDEPLQPYRRYFLDEIGPRVDTLALISRAALEVNLWIGERVTFKSTDWRDQGPLTTISCGFGRCGEETILTIDALRSVGIAARGVYVPFWSAFDNNHAWVEVLTEDGWKYLGAAEPDTRLNKAWFDRTVLRAPILLTKKSTYSSDHPDAVKTRSGWALNVTRNYLPPAQLAVNFPGSWKEEDHVWLAVFNFGTVRSLIELTPHDGKAALEVGHGDFVLIGVFQKKLFVQPFTSQTNRETLLDLNVESCPPLDFTLRYPEPPVDRDPDEAVLPAWQLKLAKELRLRRSAERNVFTPWLDSLAVDIDGYFPRLLKTLKRA